MATETFERKQTSSLRPHKLSKEIYGEDLDERFVESIRVAGILSPLRVLRDGTIVSGRRRWLAAKQLKISIVPCIMVGGEADDLDVQAAVIHSNRENERSNQQRADEFVHLKRIEVERAALRMKNAPIKFREENTEKSRPEMLGEYSTSIPEVAGKAAEIAAQQVGWSAKTAEKAAEVVEEIHKLKKRGHTKKAEDLCETLNENIAAAYREVNPPEEKEDKPKTIEELMAEEKSGLESFARKLQSDWDDCQEFIWFRSDEKGIAGSNLKAVLEAVRAAKGYGVCPKCDGKKCKHCRQSGWMPRVPYESNGGKK